MTLRYDGSNRLVNQQVGPLNVTYSYSAPGSLSQIDCGLGTTLGIVSAAAQGLGASTAINASQAVAALTDARSNTTSYTLDSLGRLLQLQTADGALQTWVLDTAGNPVNYIDQLGRVVTNSYNTYEDLTEVTYPDGTSTQYGYELTFHQITQIKDALNRLATMTYDASTGDLLTSQNALGQVTTLTWSSGLLQNIQDALGRFATNTWDGSGKRQLLSTKNALGYLTTFGHDSVGNCIRYQDAKSNITTSTFDGLRRQLSRQNALDGLASFGSDAIGNLLLTTDESNRTNSHGYDQRGLQVSLMETVDTAQQRLSTSSYGVAANLLSQTDASGNVGGYAYDVLNRVIARLEA